MVRAIGGLFLTLCAQERTKRMRLSMMSVFPSLRPPLYSNESHERRNPSLLDHEAALAQDKKLEQWV